MKDVMPVGAETSGIFIRTYYKDAERLRYTLLSIGRYCSGFSEVVVCCQESSKFAIETVTADFDFVRLVICANFEDDFLGQQITKLRANQYMKSDIIFHVDSDCVFNKPFRPEMMMERGRPVLYNQSYAYFYRNKVFSPWQRSTSILLARQVDFEFMALFPLAYPRGLYAHLELWFHREHSKTYDQIGQILPNASQELSEFNLLGAFSYYLANDLYHIHKNWSDTPPVHYLNQLAQGGQRDDRSISPEERSVIESALQQST
jgi:hypothetical protein